MPCQSVTRVAGALTGYTGPHSQRAGSGLTPARAKYLGGEIRGANWACMSLCSDTRRCTAGPKAQPRAPTLRFRQPRTSGARSPGIRHQRHAHAGDSAASQNRDRLRILPSTGHCGQKWQRHHVHLDRCERSCGVLPCRGGGAQRAWEHVQIRLQRLGNDGLFTSVRHGLPIAGFDPVYGPQGTAGLDSSRAIRSERGIFHDATNRGSNRSGRGPAGR